MNEKGIDPPHTISFEDENYWWRWLKRLQDVFPKTQTFTVTINPSSVPANSTSEQTFTVNGLTTTDIVEVNKPSHTTGLGIVNKRVSSNNTIAITFMNTTAAVIDPPSENYFIKATRR